MEQRGGRAEWPELRVWWLSLHCSELPSSCRPIAEPAWLHQTQFGTRAPRSDGSGGEAAAAAEGEPLVWPGGLRAPSYSTHAPERAGGRGGSGLVSTVRAIAPVLHVAADPGWLDGGADQPLADATAAAQAASAARQPSESSAAREAGPGSSAARRAIPMFGAGFGSLLTDEAGELAAASAAAAGAAPDDAEADGGAPAASGLDGGAGLAAGSSRTFQFLTLDDRGNVDVWFAVPLGVDAAALARGASLASLVDLQVRRAVGGEGGEGQAVPPPRLPPGAS